MNRHTFTRSLFVAAYNGSNAFLSLPAPSAVLLDSFTAPSALLLHGLTLSSAMQFLNQSINGIWVVWNQNAPVLFMGGPVACLASHIFTEESGVASEPAVSRCTWVRFPALYVAPQTKIALYANGLVGDTRLSATCELQFSEFR